MQRIHPDYMAQANRAVLAGDEDESNLKTMEGISYWYDAIRDTIGETSTVEMPLVGAVLRGIADSIYNQLGTAGLGLAVELADIVYNGTSIRRRTGSEALGKRPAEVMNNISKNEVVLVDKAKLRQHIQSIKEAINQSYEDCKNEEERLIKQTIPLGRKLELEFLGLWEEQA